MSAADFAGLQGRLERLGLIYRVDLVRSHEKLDERFTAFIERDGRNFWTPRRHAVSAQGLGGLQLKEFQSRVLDRLGIYLDELKKYAAQANAAVTALRAMEGMEAIAGEAGNSPERPGPH